MNLYQLHARPELLLNYEKAKTQVPAVAWAWAKTPNQKRQLAHVWAQDPILAYDYARHVLKGRFALGEPMIAQNPTVTYLYALNVLKKRWPAAEKTLFHGNGYWAYRYADSIMQRPWPEVEHLILKNPFWAFNYAREVIQGPWRPAEPIIKTDPDLWLQYQNFLDQQRRTF